MKRLLSAPFLLACSTVALILPWLFLGFHYSDIGWNATKAWMIVTHSGKAFWEMSWLSSMIGGLWMELTGFTILWFKLGYVLCTVVATMISYAILRLYYSTEKSAWALIPVLILSCSGFEQFAPNYYTIPQIFALSSVYFYLKSFRSFKARHIARNSIVSGFFFAITIQARLPAITLVLMFLAIAAIERFGPGQQNNPLPRLGWLAVGCVTGTGAIALVLHAAGMLDIALHGLWKTFIETSNYSGKDNIHHPSRLLSDTLIRYGKIVVFGCIAFSGAYLWKLFFPARRAQFKDPVTLGTLSCVGILTFYLAQSGWESFHPSFGILAVLFLTLILRQRRELNRERIILYTSAFFYMVCMNAGSSNPAIGNLKYDVWLIVPVALIESIKVSSPLYSTRILLLAFLVNISVLMLTTRIIQERIVLFDTSFRTTAMRGICSTRESVEEFEEVMDALNRAGIQHGDTTLCYVDIPLFHFTTQTIPALGNPWISNHFIGLPSLESVRVTLGQAARAGHLPKFVVRGGLDEPSVPKITFLDSLWGAHHYDTILQNSNFIILRRPN